MKTITSALIGMAICAAGCSISRPPAASHVSEIPPGEVWLTQQQVKDAHLEIEPVTDRPVGGTVHAAGRVTFDDLRVGHVFSPVTGRITKILAQPGQRVTKGQGLCVIQSPDMGSAISDMAKAQASLFQAERDWRRQKDLLELHAAAQRECCQGNAMAAKTCHGQGMCCQGNAMGCQGRGMCCQGNAMGCQGLPRPRHVLPRQCHGCQDLSRPRYVLPRQCHGLPRRRHVLPRQCHGLPRLATAKACAAKAMPWAAKAWAANN